MKVKFNVGHRRPDDPHRLDPPTCGCTDCLTGWSRPLDWADTRHVLLMLKGEIQNATGRDPGDWRLEIDGEGNIRSVHNVYDERVYQNG